MTRYRLPLLMLLAVTTVAAPRGAAAACSSTLPLPSDKRLANVSCDGVHPGTMLVLPSLKYGTFECAASFAFRDQAGQRYVAVPGTCHLDYDCLEDTVKDVLPPPLNEAIPRLPVCIQPTDSEIEPRYGSKGPVVRDLSGRRVGVVAYAVNKDGLDFALVRIDRNVHLDPRLPLYGGPTRLGTAGSIEESYVYSPEGVSGTPNARTGLLSGGPDYAYVVTEGLLSRPAGGSVMKPDGSAIGFLTGYLSIPGYTTQPLGPGLARANRMTGLRLSLITAPLS